MDQPVKLLSLAEIELWSATYAAALGAFLTNKQNAPGELAEGRADIAVLALRQRCAQEPAR
jgi:hypothetical protein